MNQPDPEAIAAQIFRAAATMGLSTIIHNDRWHFLNDIDALQSPEDGFSLEEAIAFVRERAASRGPRYRPGNGGASLDTR